ncbi:MAG: hypothetical protein IPM82_25775 [Saprospiraceae bacterium]|nr:hypothetical protein [Saprospiraceae bacterium]
MYLGDNIYGDSNDLNELRRKYNQLKAKPEFQRMKSHAHPRHLGRPRLRLE